VNFCYASLLVNCNVGKLLNGPDMLFYWQAGKLVIERIGKTAVFSKAMLLVSQYTGKEEYQ
jgi:hypothetical protein